MTSHLARAIVLARPHLLREVGSFLMRIIQVYVTGYPFKAILSPGMYAASSDNEQVFRPPFVQSRSTTNHST